MRWWFAAAGLVAALCVAQSESAASPACDTAVVVEGDSAAASSLRDALTSRGIRTRQAQPCPALTARVTPTGTQLSVELRASNGRSETRTLSTTEIAAIWIESWTRTDIGSALLPTRWQARPPAPTARRVAAAVGRPTTLTRRLPPGATSTARPPRRIILGLGAQSLTGGDDSTWSGIGADVCIEVGGVCLGVSGRYARNLGFTRDDALVAADRTALDLGVTASIPLRIGRGTLLPQLSLGGRWASTSGAIETPPPPDPCAPGDPNDPANPDGTNPGDPTCPDGTMTTHVRHTSRLLRTGARLSYAIPVADAAAITLGVGASWLPGAHTDNFSEGQIIGPDGTIIDDPNLPPEPGMSLPGEPSWMWSAGIGLQVELQ